MRNYFQIDPVVFDMKIIYIFPIYTCEKLTPFPGSHVFQHIKFILAILVEGHPSTIVPKNFQIGLTVYKFLLWVTWQSEVCVE